MYPRVIENLLNQLTRLPGVGRRSAERMVFWLLNNTKEEVDLLTKSIQDLKERLGFCQRCNNLSETPVCPICANAERNQKLVCVVENPKDLLAIERSGAFKGIYHVLLGTISPTDGRGPEDIRIQHLLDRIGSEEIEEVIIATDPDNEGEMTSLYLIDTLKPYAVKISRIGLGIPMGSSVEYVDLSTLTMSLNSRKEVLH